MIPVSVRGVDEVRANGQAHGLGDGIGTGAAGTAVAHGKDGDGVGNGMALGSEDGEVNGEGVGTGAATTGATVPHGEDGDFAMETDGEDGDGVGNGIPGGGNTTAKLITFGCVAMLSFFSGCLLAIPTCCNLMHANPTTNTMPTRTTYLQALANLPLCTIARGTAVSSRLGTGL